MGNSLENKTPASVYRDLVRFDNEGAGVSAAPSRLYDGAGTALPLRVGTQQVVVQVGTSGGLLNGAASLVVAGGSPVVQIASLTGGTGQIEFGDEAAVGVGGVRYEHGSDVLSLRAGGLDAAWFAADGTFTPRGAIQVSVSASTGALRLNPLGGVVQLGGGTWDVGPVRFGPGGPHVWADTSNVLRVKVSAPTGPTDGQALATVDQIPAGVSDYEINVPQLGFPAFQFEVTDPDGVVRQVASVDADGSANFNAVRGQSLEISDPPYPTFEQYEVNGDPLPYTLVYDTDSGGIVRTVGYIPFEPIEDDAGIPPDDIRAFVPGIDQTGLVDVSTQVKTAHDLAYAAGLTSLYFETAYLAPSALRLGNVHFRTRSGKGRLIGTYRKQVIPESVGALPQLPDLIPAAHLAKFSAAVAAATPSSPAIVVYMSDSWGNPNQLVGVHSQFEMLLRRALKQQYPEKANSIVVVNRAIGGTTWDDAAGTPSYSSTTWGTNPLLPWLDYIRTMDLTSIGLGAAETPDLVLLMFGMNHSSVASPTTVSNVQFVIEQARAISSSPDVVLIASTIPSSTAVDKGAKAELEGRLSMAGLVRSYAAIYGLGLVDFGRLLTAAHWGQDERLTYFRRIGQDLSVSWPYTWAEETIDFAARFTTTTTASTFWATGDGQLTCTLSSIAGNRVVLDRDSGTGNVAIAIFAATGQTFLARTVTSVPASPGVSTPVLEISAQGPNLLIRWRNTTVFEGPVPRGGGQHAPVIGFGGGGTITMLGEDIAVSDFTLVEPSLTADNLWGATDDGPIGGNGAEVSGNHLSELGRAAVMARGLLESRWR